MARREIFLEQDEILRKKSKHVTNFDEKLGQLLDDMIETMHYAEGVGLAAVQVGILKQAVVIDVGDGVIELVNPQIIFQQGEVEEVEGCLSCPGEYGLVKRPQQVTVRAQDRQGNIITVEGEDFLARAFCHEIDHLAGRVYKDIATQMLDIDAKRSKARKG